MPRQPYLPTFSEKHYAVGALVLKDRDHLCAVIGKCVALWSHVDNEMGTLFSLLLGVESDATLEVFLRLRRASNQIDALNGAAKYKLSGKDLQTFNALVKVYASLESERNALAHGCFGICPDDPDLLFWIDIKHHVHFIVEALSKERQGQFSSDRHAKLKENMFVYRQADLENLLANMESFWWAVFYFNGYLRSPNETARQSEMEQMRDYPIIKAALAAAVQTL